MLNEICPDCNFLYSIDQCKKCDRLYQYQCWKIRNSWVNKLKYANVPSKFKEFHLGNYTPNEFSRSIRELFSYDFRRYKNFLIISKDPRKMTQFLVTLIQEIMHDRQCFLIREEHFSKQFKHLFSYPKEYYPKKEKIMKTEVLFVDNLGLQATPLWVKQEIKEIIDDRFDELRPTVIFTQRTIGDLAKFFPNIYNEIKETGVIIEA
jgi:DNA replication protein DnaC